MPSTTPIYALPYPVLADPADVPADILALANRLEVVLSGRYRGALTPAAFIALTGVADGDIADVIVDATLGIVWRFRYRAASASAYKWENIGGPPLQAKVDANEGTNSTTFTNLTTVGPQVTVPLAGDYLVQVGARTQPGSGASPGMMSYAVGATAAIDIDGAFSGTGDWSVYGPVTRKTAVPAATAIVAKYRIVVGTTACIFMWRSLVVTPVRVSQ